MGQGAATVLGDAGEGAAAGAAFGPWGAAIGALGGAALGAYQLHQANKIHPQRPTYTIPQSIENNTAMWQNQADTVRMPGAGIAENAIYGNQSSLVRQAVQSGGSAGDILASLGGIGASTNNGLNQIANQGAQYNIAGKENLTNANNTLGDYQNEAFDYNQNEPYELQYMRKMALQSAGLANLDATAQNIGQAGQTGMIYGAESGGNGNTTGGTSFAPATPSAGGYNYTPPTGQPGPEPSFQG